MFKPSYTFVLVAALLSQSPCFATATMTKSCSMALSLVHSDFSPSPYAVYQKALENDPQSESPFFGYLIYEINSSEEILFWEYYGGANHREALRFMRKNSIPEEQILFGGSFQLEQNSVDPNDPIHGINVLPLSFNVKQRREPNSEHAALLAKSMIKSGLQITASTEMNLAWGASVSNLQVQRTSVGQILGEEAP